MLLITNRCKLLQNSIFNPGFISLYETCLSFFFNVGRQQLIVCLMRWRHWTVNRRQYISSIRIVNCRPVNRRQYISSIRIVNCRPVNRRQLIGSIRIVNCRPVNHRQSIDYCQLSAFLVSGHLNGLFSFGCIYGIVRQKNYFSGRGGLFF